MALKYPRFQGGAIFLQWGYPIFSDYQAYGSLYQAYGSPYQAYGSPYQAYGSPYQAYGSPYQAYGSPYIKPMAHHISSLWLAICMIKGEQIKMSNVKNTLAFLKCFFYSPNLLGVKEKVLGIEPRKILTPVPGLKDS